MALIACADCGATISDLAPACIHCGRPNPAPLSSSVPPQATPQLSDPVGQASTVSSAGTHGNPGWVWAGGALALLVAMGFCAEAASTSSVADYEAQRYRQIQRDVQRQRDQDIRTLQDAAHRLKAQEEANRRKTGRP